ncbi:MAG: class I SAM-dependent methyltransferase [Egibacteraceae bacterium]
MDLLRCRARVLQPLIRRRHPAVPDRLHFGCGDRRVLGWLNADVVGSEWDVDLAGGRLPWPSGSFTVLVGQHVIEHLEMVDELLPLLRELHRVARPGAVLWLTFPDLEKVCAGYAADRGRSLYEDLRRRHGDYEVGPLPVQAVVNHLFHQRGQHKNLFDSELIGWLLAEAGFVGCEILGERQFLDDYPAFPARGDDGLSLYVRARARSANSAS